MPTSKTRSGNSAANFASPTGCNMAAVIATMSGRLGSADINDAVGELGGELGEPNGLQAGGRYRDNVGAVAGDLDNFIAEDFGPAEAGSHDWQAGFGVNLGHGMEAVGDVLLCGGVAAAFLRRGVHNDRAVIVPGPAQCALDAGDVVPVDRAEVFQSEVFK